MNFTKNTLFKIIGISAIIYFLAFHENDRNVNSVKNTFSGDNIKKNLFKAGNKIVEIKSNLNKKKEYDLRMKKKEETAEINKLNKESKNSTKEVKCNDLIVVKFTKTGNSKIFTQENHQMRIDNSDLSLAIIGMKINDKKTIIINENLDNKEIEFIYSVELLEIINIDNKNINKNEKNNEKCS